MTSYLITGVAGFIGSHLAETLLNQGEKVIGIDEFNDYYAPQLKRNNVQSLLKYPQFELMEADLLDLDWPKLLKSVSVVFHQAAQAGVRASWGQSFRLYTEKNINATQVILEAAKDTPTLQRLVAASSSSVYGNAETLPTSESICPQPVSPYGITKLAAERLCSLYYDNFGVPVTSLRYFTVYGPRQRPDMAFHKFFQSALRGEAINIYGDGQQTRDFTFVADAIAANLAAATIPEASGKVFNIGGGSRVVLADILDTMESIMGKPLQRNYIENAKGDARHTSADITFAQTILGYQPKISLAEGLTKEWEWIQNLYA
jgi:nucleoside-diphosphate-sugar epimerase